MKKALWIGAVFKEKDAINEIAISLAANRWQLGLMKSLIDDYDFKIHILGEYFSYLNIIGLRDIDLKHRYYNGIIRKLRKEDNYDFIITYNLDIYKLKSLVFIKEKTEIPIFAIIADVDKNELKIHRELEKLCDKVFYLSYGFYKESTHPNKYFLEGGFDSYKLKVLMNNNDDPKLLLYTGGIGAHGGLDMLLDAFNLLNRDDVELWICGKGDNKKLKDAVKNTKINYLGVVSEEELINISNLAYAFINPRPSNFGNNYYNFPSKILEYLAYQKIIISTRTAGISPEYENALVFIDKENPEELAKMINTVLDYNELQYHDRIELQKSLSESKLWKNQIKKIFE
jgi:glycosyltransferase involved in cell wall biosynthesis